MNEYGVGYAYFGRPRGVQFVSGGVLGTLYALEEYIELPPTDIQLTENNKLLRITRYQNEDGKILHIISMYLYAKEKNADRGGAFVGACIGLYECTASIISIYTCLCEMLSKLDTKEYFDEDRRFLKKLEGEDIKNSISYKNLQKSAKRIDENQVGRIVGNKFGVVNFKQYESDDKYADWTLNHFEIAFIQSGLNPLYYDYSDLYADSNTGFILNNELIPEISSVEFTLDFNRKLQEELEELKLKLKNINNDLTKLEESKETINKELENKKLENKKLSVKNKALREENLDFEGRNKQLREQHSHIRKVIAQNEGAQSLKLQLEKDIQDLRQKEVILLNKQEQLIQANLKFEQIGVVLQRKNKEAEKSNKSKDKRVNELRDINIKLKENNTKLKKNNIKLNEDLKTLRRYVSQQKDIIQSYNIEMNTKETEKRFISSVEPELSTEVTSNVIIDDTPKINKVFRIIIDLIKKSKFFLALAALTFLGYIVFITIDSTKNKITQDYLDEINKYCEQVEFYMDYDDKILTEYYGTLFEFNKDRKKNKHKFEDLFDKAEFTYYRVDKLYNNWRGSGKQFKEFDDPISQSIPDEIETLNALVAYIKGTKTSQLSTIELKNLIILSNKEYKNELQYNLNLSNVDKIDSLLMNIVPQKVIVFPFSEGVSE